ncbi:MAG: response regulator [Desulfobacter sp.]|nr:MAG: response regulator [Desulfobacter sp.]
MFFFEDRLWDVFSAESGEEALDMLEHRPCNAAVVDIRMGGMDGETFIRKTLALYPEMVFVICTGSPEFGISTDLCKNPRVADRVFSKPVDRIEDLEDAVLALLSP